MIRMTLLRSIQVVFFLMISCTQIIAQDNHIIGEWKAVKTVFKGFPEMKHAVHPCHTIVLKNDSTFILHATESKGSYGWTGNWRLKENRIYFFNRSVLNFPEKKLDDIDYKVKLKSNDTFWVYFQGKREPFNDKIQRVKVFVIFNRKNS